jgi:mannosyltransferase
LYLNGRSEEVVSFTLLFAGNFRCVSVIAVPCGGSIPQLAQSEMSERPQHRTALNRAAIALITGVGLLLRISHLTSKSFWMDEGFTAFMARTDLHSFLALIRSGEMNMVLYYALVRLWTHFSVGEFWIRLLSVFASTATIPVIYLIGKRLGGRNMGLLAALLMAIHPGHILYAQEARSYSFEVFLVCLAGLYLLRFVETGSSLDLIRYLCSCVLAIYSHVLAILAIVAQLPALATCRKRIRINRLSTILIFGTLLLCLPMLFFVLTRGTGLATWIPPLSWHAVLDGLRLITLPKFSALYVLVCVAAVLPVFRRQLESERWTLVFLVCWLFLPISFLATVSIYKPIFLARLLLICVPPVCLLAAAGTLAMPPRVRCIAFALLAIASLGAVRSQYRHTEAKEDWRGATAYVCSHAVRGDGVEIVPEYGRFVFDYYRELHGIPADQFSYVSKIGIALPPSGTDREWLMVFGATNSNSVATAALSRALRTPGGPYCVTQSAQFNLIEVWLLHRC